MNEYMSNLLIYLLIIIVTDTIILVIIVHLPLNDEYSHDEDGQTDDERETDHDSN